MEAELAAGQPVTGVEQAEEAGVGKGRLFRDRATAPKVRKSPSQKLAGQTAWCEKMQAALLGFWQVFCPTIYQETWWLQEGKASGITVPAILSQASAETADQQKKSVFTRFAAKFKT